ncbi:Virulence factor mviN homolog [Legionella wadsworthii]|uniref:Probable lipid II flippase MurJ n=1 Tax=Legionella wadsworthii TaxID=28088 RepID=A0A378LNN3_9GAMM|nr:murein biosynthesis integral membrane protein MurJ [Legionella wadsworthii]STY28000.1 Virulence factor mviN homolog [Legionella wadsworthii]
MYKLSLAMMLLTLVSKVTGFARIISLSYYFGISYISDAFLISQTIPVTIFTFIGTGIITNYIPIFSDILVKEGFDKANRFSNKVFNLLMVLSSVIVLLVLIFTEPIVKIFASGFDGSQLNLAVILTRISIFSIYFSSMVFLYSSFLQIRGNFLIPTIVSIPMNMITVASIFLATKTTITVLGIGSVVATFSQVVLLIPYVIKNKYRFQFNWKFKDAHIKKMLLLSLPVILGASVNQINIIISQTLASNAGSGGIAAMNYAVSWVNLVHGVVATTIATIMYPTISKLISENKITELKSSIANSMSTMILLVVPIAVGTIFFSNLIIQLLFQRGAFDQTATDVTASILVFYAIGMLWFGLMEILSRSFYASSDTRTPTINAGIAIVINIILSFILFPVYGVPALAASSSISAFISTLLLIRSLRKKIGTFGLKKVFVLFTKVVICSVLMGIISKMAFELLKKTNLNELFSFAITAFIAILVYALLLVLVKGTDANHFIQLFKLKRKNALQITNGL